MRGKRIYRGGNLVNPQDRVFLTGYHTLHMIALDRIYTVLHLISRERPSNACKVTYELPPLGLLLD